MPMTNAEIVDYVEEKLLAQGCQSLTGPEDEKLCCYRGGNGERCGIGWLISDKDYIPEMEGLRVLDIYSNWEEPPVLKAVKKFVGRSTLGDKSIRLLQKVQAIHDEIDPKNWKQGFEDIRKFYL